MKNYTLSVKVSEDIHYRLKIFAAHQRKTIKDILLNALDHVLKNTKPNEDLVLQAFLTAPVDDESLSVEEERAVKKALNEKGPEVSWDDFKKQSAERRNKRCHGK